MIRVVIDTNVLISALLTERGAEASVFSFIESGHLLWCVSEPILDEYRAVISRPKFSGVSTERREEVLSSFSVAKMFAPEASVVASPDEPDNRFLECAEVAAAEYLVTGNARHFPKRWEQTRIVNARQLVKALEE
jgi:uncharacterized protein